MSKGSEETQTAPTIGAPLQPSEAAPLPLSASDRYPRGLVLGEGGMGAVHLCDDAQMGRQVAVKTLRPELRSNVSAVARFVREARVQGQLEHPSMVPVYDLGVDDSGEIFFTMKRVRGKTLLDVLEEARVGEHDRHRLLSDFARICLAVHFAHEHGVVHRDLKPANLMLGEFGEVYVLDWGLAKLVGQPDEASSGPSTPSQGQTSAGAMMGTPGYMAPEQARSAGEVTKAADIYSLGCILFEIATLQPLHEGSAADAIRSTLTGANAAASERAPEMNVVPELEAICVRATQLEPEARYASAREMFEAADAILKGERDEQVRRDMARLHTERARESTHDTIDGRRQAMQELGRALAIDPSDAEAFGMLAALMRDPPSERPDEVRVALLQSQQRQNRGTARIAMFAYGSLALFAPVVLWLGVVSWWQPACFFVLAAACTALTAYATRQTYPPTSLVFLTFVLSNVMLLTLWKFYGPFVLVAPALIANTMGYTLLLQGRWRIASVVLGVLSLSLPVAAEMLGWVAPTYMFEQTTITITSSVVRFDLVSSTIFIALAHASSLVIACTTAAGVRRQLSEAEERLYLQDWHLRALVPAAEAA